MESSELAGGFGTYNPFRLRFHACFVPYFLFTWLKYDNPVKRPSVLQLVQET